MILIQVKGFVYSLLPVNLNVVLAYPGSSIAHARKLKDESILNNQLCHAPVEVSQFSQLESKEVVFHYQVCLGVFHMFTPMYSKEQFEKALSTFLKNARTTFLELPEATKYYGNEAEKNWELVNYHLLNCNIH